jgi:putative SOS response-associated peptidase YedK
MCGRFSIYSTAQELTSRFDLPITEEYKFHYNATPGQQLPLILNERDDAIVLGKWGLLPVWKQDVKDTGIINTRADSLDTKPMFKRYFQNKHCLVIANGFFEWLDTGNGKIPYYITLKNKEPFAFAGIWDLYKDTDDITRPMFSIITTEPNKSISKIHNRMPVILPREQEKYWLDVSRFTASLKKLLIPYPNKELEIYEVSKLVNSPLNDTKDIIKLLV